ncbi:MAG: hypothetical protein H7319_11030 [Spirosoma sp.]|nr:hypothetical protein [Spirosoma sp.]
MWYFLIDQQIVDTAQYRALQRQAALTEVELFNEPYQNWYVFSVEKDNYKAFIDHLDLSGLTYDLRPARPTRDELLDTMR